MSKKLKPIFKRLLKTQKAKMGILEYIPKGSACAEVGVWKGQYSNSILKTVKPEKLILIDPWIYCPIYKNRMYGGKVAKRQKDMDNIYGAVKIKFKNNKQVQIIRQSSDNAVSGILDKTLDFIYIDGNHSYQFVRNDLKRYFAKIKDGGIIAGDDVLWGIGEGFPVFRALIYFLAKNRDQCRLLSLRGGQFVIKKEFRKGGKIDSGHSKTIGNLIVFVVLTFFVCSLWKNFPIFLDFVKDINLKLLILSILLLVVGQTYKLNFSLTSIRLVRKNISILEAYRIWFLSQASKYLPGAIWPYLSRAYLYKKKGLKLSDSGLLVVIETVTLVIINIVLGIPSILMFKKNTYLFALISLVVLPSILFWLFRKQIVRKLKRYKNVIDSTTIKKFILISLVSSAAIATGFYILVSSISYTFIPILPGLFIFPLAWAIGILVFFAPIGVGPREFTLALFFSSYFDYTELIFVLAIARLWWFAGDAINISIALLLQFSKNIQKRK